MERIDRRPKVARSRSRSRNRSRSRGRDRSRDRPSGARLADKRVYISNIPYDSRWQDIKDLFRKEVGEVSFVELFSDDNEKPRGCGIIEFENQITAKKAIEKMHRHELAGRKIVVKEDYDVERDKSGRIVTGGVGGGGGGGGGGVGGGGGGGGRPERSRDRGDRDRDHDWDNRREPSPNMDSSSRRVNTYGLSHQFLESLGIDGNLIPKVFVSNLDFRVDDKKMKDVFRLAGRVICAEVNKDKDGKSRGHGTVEFEHPVEAVQAISMLNNQQLYDRKMHVKMDRLADPIGDLNHLPDGLKGIGMGLGLNGQPLIDVARNLPSGNSAGNVSGLLGTAALGTNNSLATSLTMNAMGVNQLATMMASNNNMASQQQIEQSAAAAAAAAANVFGITGLGGTGGALGALMGSSGNNNFQNSLQLGNVGNLGGNLGGSAQQSPFQNNNIGGASFRDLERGSEYGYSTSVYSTPSNNYNTAYQREKSSFGNGNSPQTSNTCVVSNLPPTCTWQMLKTKFRECGDVVYAEMKDKSTGIVRFTTDRDAERAIKVFDGSRVDGRVVEVRFL